ncbi:MAG: hypothetical protein QOJ35_303 [Solirubrobacteraceae bacterium]|jgi:DNA-binding CsgD family transcriptional regulator|nr:hypothetical protein [Solirubrobacteraceae bacterium]
MAHPAGHDLLEREDILAEVEAFVDATRAGSGAVLWIDGEPGIGKTALLESVGSRAGARGLLVLAAGGAELEADLAYAVVRRLFAPVVRRARADAALWEGAAAVARPVIDPAGVAPGRGQLERYAVWHGLLWLLASVAEREPLAVLVDDAQWADEPSRGWLDYFARRVAELPVLLVLASRIEGGGEAMAAASSATRSFRLGPLSERASAALVRRAIGSDAPADVCRACRAATGGNPFYLGELVAARGAALLESAATPVEQLVPASVVRFVVARLRALGPHAVGLARAVAVLGSHVRLRHAAAVAEIDPAHADGLADELCAAAILRPGRPLEFVHPIVRAAVYGDLGDGARSTLHHRAARILAEDGAEPAEIAVQLLAAEPYGDAWVVERLREAATGALAQGEPRTAVAYLARALDEPPDHAQRGDVLFELGGAERRLFSPEAEGHLREALRLTEHPRRRAEIVSELTPILIQPGRLQEWEEVVADVLPAAIEHAPDLAAVLTANHLALVPFHLSAAQVDTDAAHHLLELLDPQELLARMLRCALAWEATFRGRPLSEVGPLLDTALSGIGERIAQAGDFTIVAGAAITATLCERFALAEEACDAALVESARRGSVFGSSVFWATRSGVVLRLGRVVGAEADARQALDAMASFEFIAPIAMLVDALVERGEIAEALELLARTGYDGDLPPTVLSLLFVPRRIRLRIAAGQLDAALADMELAERLATGAGMRCAPVITWRADGAMACIAAGHVERARALADEQLRLARAFGAPGLLGVALRVCGLAHGPPGGLALLADSVATLTPTPMRLELAKSLAALGGAQRRAGERVLARATLAAALDLADACGASAVAEQARTELRIAGARPRRNRSSGPDALTATELRTATLAAGGMTNTQIAQALFVTAKTVERHLTNAYVKLAIGSRHDLAGVLGGG